jgi:hypothetical protein
MRKSQQELDRKKWQRERANTQITLGKLIKVLKMMPKNTEVANLNYPHSYRGYYMDLAFEISDGTRLASDLLVECRATLGKVFEGYKGGYYVMDVHTPIWVANYGLCGEKLLTIGKDGLIITTTDDYEIF